MDWAQGQYPVASGVHSQDFFLVYFWLFALIVIGQGRETGSEWETEMGWNQEMTGSQTRT